jgi:hypothetical protein
VRRFLRIACIVVAAWLSAGLARAAELRVPDNPVVGEALSLATLGEGEATLYLIGPGQIIKRQVRLGHDVHIKPDELHSAGRWIATLRHGELTESQTFWMSPARPRNLNFLARPSRVPVARQHVITGVAFVFDEYQNMVLRPAQVRFSLSVNGSGASETVESRDGVAWINSSSAKKAGAAQFVAAVGETTVRRLVQQVASDPCNLRMHVAQITDGLVIVETDPIRDCTGNPVPDGTIVTFTQIDRAGRSTVDARIKKGVARAQLPFAEGADISVAAGVMLGNELHLGGHP